uniref:Peptidase S1 domain-containing protein n=1 Tax=Cyprinus carpio TaxID=7962 RepID=A0A8C2DHJ1_CYPCA
PRYAGEDLVFKKSKTYLQQSCKFSDIVYGQKAKKNSMLYMASVQTDGKHNCGGVLIHPSYVFTASNCNKSKAPKGANLKRYKVQNKHKHPSFKDVKTVNDIMLLELSKKQKNGKGMKTIRILSKDKPLKPKTKCKVVNGFLETDLLTINSSICQTMWKEVRVKLPNNVLCVCLNQYFEDSCDYPNFPNVYTEISKYK